MIQIKNKIIPFNGYKCLTFWPFIFYKGDMTDVDLNHESIHARQQIELLLIGFYLVYFVEWIFKGYYNISFEKESYQNENNLSYLKTRKWFAMWKKTI